MGLKNENERAAIMGIPSYVFWKSFRGGYSNIVLYRNDSFFN